MSVEFKSRIIGIYLKNPPPEVAAMTPEQLRLADELYAAAEADYNNCDTIVECFEPHELVEQFKSVADMKEFCGVRKEYEQEIMSTAW